MADAFTNQSTGGGLLGNRHRRTDFDKARDELMSLVHQCNVLQADTEQQNAWLKETVEYMADRFPGLSKMELAQLELVGRRFCAPVIAHGAESTALTQDRGSATEAGTAKEGEMQAA
jgi:hypothetical protein